VCGVPASQLRELILVLTVFNQPQLNIFAIILPELVELLDTALSTRLAVIFGLVL
jgi:hypothetical protein